MKTKLFASALSIAAMLVIAPVAASADTITQMQTATVPSTAVDVGTFSPDFTFNEFNPGSNGVPLGSTLTEVDVSLTGPLTLASGIAFLDVVFSLSDPIRAAVNNRETFPLSGVANTPVEFGDFGLSMTTQIPQVIALWIGTGTQTDSLTNNGGTSATIVGVNNTPLTETVTFDFTTPTATPLPAALPLFATGLGALGLFGWRRKRKAAAA